MESYQLTVLHRVIVLLGLPDNIEKWSPELKPENIFMNLAWNPVNNCLEASPLTCKVTLGALLLVLTIREWNDEIKK